MSDIKIDILRTTTDLQLVNNAGTKMLLRPGTGLLDAEGNPLGGGDTFITAYRTTDGTPVNNSTVLVADDVLKFAIGANEAWAWECLLFWHSASAHMDVTFSGPASPSYVKWGVTPADTYNLGMASAFDSLDVVAFNGMAVADGNNCIAIHGTVVNGVNAGTIQLKIAQDTATVEDTKLLKGSRLIAHKLA